MSAPIYILVDTAVELPVNAMPLIDDSDFKSREVAIAYNAAGMDLVWNFVTPAGVITQTAVTPTTAGDYDWTHIGDGMYKIEVPASGGASINNNTEGYGWFSGICNGVLPWVSRTYCFAPANVVNSLVLGSDLLDTSLAQWKGSVPASLADTDKIPASTQHMANDVITAAAAAADFGAELAALVETYIVNEGDATAVMQAIADLIAQDWVAGDATPLAIVAALKADAQWSNLATMASELAKVPKSDGSVSHNATAIAAIQSGLGTAANQATILARTGYVDGYVYYSSNGTDGAVEGTNGTIDNPCSDEADLLTLAVARGIKRIRILEQRNSALPVTNEWESIDVSGYEIDLNHAWLDLAWGGVGPSQTVTTGNTRFRDGALYGAAPAAGDQYHRVQLYGLAALGYMPISGADPPELIECGIPSVVRFNTDFTAGLWASWYGCYPYGDSDYTTINVNDKEIRLRLDGWVGDILITNMTDAGSVIKVYGYGGRITIDSSCTAGTVRFSSHMEVTNNSAGGGTTADLISEPGGVSSFTVAAKAEIQATAAAALDAISATALERFRSVDTGATTAVAGSIAKISQGSAGGSVTVAGFDSAALAQLAGTSVSISSHLAAAQQIEIVQGDDYEDDDGTALTFTFSGITTDLTSATAHLYWERGDTQEDWTALSVTASGDDWIIKFERTAAQTALLTAAKDWKAQLVVIPDGTTRRITLLRTRSARVLDRFDD